MKVKVVCFPSETLLKKIKFSLYFIGETKQQPNHKFFLWPAVVSCLQGKLLHRWHKGCGNNQPVSNFTSATSQSVSYTQDCLGDQDTDYK